MARLTRLIGEGPASDLMMTGRIIPASEALQMRLVDRVVPPAKLLDVAREVAVQIADNPAAGVRAIKKIMQEETLLSLEEADDYELRAFVACLDTEEARERIRAFVEKRLKGNNGTDET
jgi:enoyl-CoA hydratase/carnithine racemase